MGEKPGESWDIIFSKNLKKCFFQALAKHELEKIILNFAQKSIFLKIVYQYPQNNHQEVVSATSNAKKWIFRIILKLFSPGNFFHTTFSFGSLKNPKFQGFSVFLQNLFKKCFGFFKAPWSQN